MRGRAVGTLVGLFSTALICAAASGGAPPAQTAAPKALNQNETQNDTIRRYCVGCHNDTSKRGELSLASFDVAHAADHADVAEKMIRKLRVGLMPPKSAARKPDAAARLALVEALETKLDAAAAGHPNPGRRSFQRLNRAEYAAAVRALFGLDVDVNPFLPA